MIRALIAICCAATLTLSASADIHSIDFEGPSSFPTSPYTEDGFTVTLTGSHTASITDDDTDGDDELLVEGGFSVVGSVTLTESDGSTFDLLSLEIEDVSIGFGTEVSITSDLGGSISFTETALVIDFEDSAVVGDTTLWDGVTTVTISTLEGAPTFVTANIDAISVDDLETVPEPSALALAALAALGLVIRRRMGR